MDLEIYKEYKKCSQRWATSQYEAREKSEEFSRQGWEEAASDAVTGLLAPLSYGGRNYNLYQVCSALMGVGYGTQDAGLAFGIGAQLLSCIRPLVNYGSEYLKDNYLEGACKGSLIIANAITEINEGSNAYDMSTYAERTGDGYVISGTKSFITNAPVADLILVYAETDNSKKAQGGITAFLIDAASDGVERSGPISKLGLRTVTMGEVTFNNCHVSEKNVLGEVGGGTMIFRDSMIWERIGLSALHIGCLEKHLDNTIAYANERKVYGQSIGNYQAISHKLAELKVEIEAVKSMIEPACKNANSRSKADLWASMINLKATETYKRGLMDLLQVYGGKGYVNDHPVGLALKDALSSTVYSGTSEIQKSIISRWIGIKNE